MDQRRSPVPSYFDQPTESVPGEHANTQPTQQETWNPPPPPPEYANINNDKLQEGGTRPPVITVTTTPAYVASGQQNQQLLILGNCPSCRIGFIRSEFDTCGIFLAIVFFPVGVLCCLCMIQKRCNHCSARF